jgi:hypothetical protein
MSLVIVDDILEEGGFSYTDFKFADNTSFRNWISKRITWIDAKIKTLVGDDTYAAACDDIKFAEMYWVISSMLRKRQVNIASGIEGGFAIGSLRIDNASTAARGLVEITQDLFIKAQTLLAPYAPLTRADFLVVADEELDEDELLLPPNRFWLRYGG